MARSNNRAMSSNATQIPLKLSPQQLYQLDNFYFSQQELASTVFAFCQRKHHFLYLWGDTASGKTHLLLAMADVAQQQQKTTLYLPLAELVKSASPEVLQGIENQQLVCIDDIDAVKGIMVWEQALFHCFNRLKEEGGQLLVASKYNPATLALSLPDLQSRLATGLIYQLDSLNDNAKQHVLQVQSQARGLDMPDDVAQYLLRHHSRDLRELMHCLQRLDKASMVEKRRLTSPFVRQVLHNDQD